MTWRRRASMATALAALLLGSACAKQQDTRTEQPTPHTGEQASADRAAGQQPGATPGSPAAAPATPGAGGDMAVASTVRGPDNQPVALASTWEKGPAVLVFYRGHW